MRKYCVQLVDNLRITQQHSGLLFPTQNYIQQALRITRNFIPIFYQLHTQSFSQAFSLNNTLFFDSFHSIHRPNNMHNKGN